MGCQKFLNEIPEYEGFPNISNAVEVLRVRTNEPDDSHWHICQKVADLLTVASRLVAPHGGYCHKYQTLFSHPDPDRRFRRRPRIWRDKIEMYNDEKAVAYLKHNSQRSLTIISLMV
jgi:hypothetical protein